MKDEDDDGVEAMGSEKEQSEDGSGEGEENNDDDDDDDGHFKTAKRSLFRKKTDLFEDSN